MPVRKIPKNHLVVTGGYSSDKADRLVGFESLLEKEYMLFLDFDETILTYEEQPVRIPVTGVPRGYTVDLLVHFADPARPSELVEVKPQYYLDRHSEKYAPKFAAADEYCKEKGWHFVIKTEADIRIPKLQNLKFLRRYRNIAITEQQRETIIALLKQSNGHASSELLLNALPDSERDAWLPVIWHLLLTKNILTNFEIEMPVDVPLWLKGSGS